MRKNVVFYITLVITVLPFALFANNYKLIVGKVQDASSGKALPFASISLSSNSISNVSNSEGIFSIKIPTNLIEKDTMNISYLGYNTAKIALADIEKEKITVKLNPVNLTISPVIIRPEEVQVLFNSVFASIKDNYLQKNSSQLGFYREIIKRGSKYVTLSEAVVEIDKSPYNNGFTNDNIAIYKGRGSRNFKIEDTLFVKLQGGPTAALWIDIMKNPFIGTDLLSAPLYYDFKLGPSTYLNGEKIFTIEFSQKDSVVEPLFRGKLYVENSSLAVIRAEFNMNVENYKNSWKYFVKRKPDNVNLSVDKAYYIVNYKKVNSKWVLDYSRLEILFTAKYKNKILKNKFSILAELAVTDIIGNKSRINNKTKLRPKDIMSEKVNDFTDENFWEDYNVIEPEGDIEGIISKIIRQLKKIK